MIDIAPLLKIFPLLALSVISPGPDFMIVSSIALSRGKMAGIETGAGIATGVFFYAVLGLMGVSALMQHIWWLAVAVKIVGGVYLAYLGAMMWRSTLQKRASALAQNPKVPRRNAYLTGLSTNLTNPKVIAFFTSIFALALTPQTSLQTKAALAVMASVTALVWFSFVAVCLANPRVRARYQRMRKGIDRAAGSVMILFGIKLVASAAE